MKNKAVVFGGSGFLGSHVADELSKRGFEVLIFDIRKNTFLRKDQTMIFGDILDRTMVMEAIKGCDYVYHFAAIADLKEARENPFEAVKFNVLGTTNILEACRFHKVKRFIFSSSIYVYSENGSFYRSTKQACELIIENYQEEYTVPFTILRYGSLYGPRANDFNFIHQAIKQALIYGKIERKGDGNEIRDYINVLDAACMSVDILSEEYCNKHVMITGVQTLKVSELLTMIKEILGNKIQLDFRNEENEGHYLITPYSFRPRVAYKIIPKNFHDLGQGILDCIYQVYDSLSEQEKSKVKILNLQ